jgi:hypothetical protein
MRSGGASFFFTRIRKPSDNGVGFNFKIKNLSRLDVVSYESDRFGSISSVADRGSVIPEYKAFSGKSDNESIFKEGLSIDDLESIVVHDDAEKADVLKEFSDRGITHLADGRPVSDIVLLPTEKKGKKP